MWDGPRQAILPSCDFPAPYRFFSLRKVVNPSAPTVLLDALLLQLPQLISVLSRSRAITHTTSHGHSFWFEDTRHTQSQVTAPIPAVDCQTESHTRTIC